MKKKSKSHSNLKFMDEDKFCAHPILMYENKKRALEIQFRYLEHGLIKGEHAIYLTYIDPQDVEDDISDYIDVAPFENNGLFHIVQISDKIPTVEKALKQLEYVLKKGMSYGGRFRLTGETIINNIDTRKGKELELSVEKKIQKTISKYKYSFLCPYKITKIKDNFEKEWMFDIFKNHHDVIYEPESGKGTSFDADFMT